MSIFGGPRAVLSGLEIADAVRRQREYLRLEGRHRFDLLRRARRWWLRRQPRIVIEGFDPTPSWRGGPLNPNSYNLRLHPEMIVYDVKRYVPDEMRSCTSKEDWAGVALDMREDNPTRRVVIPPEGYLLKPGRVYLARTVQHTESYNCRPCVAGRSSIGRLGIAVHITAGYGDVGFPGTWTLELEVVHPVWVYPNCQICQIDFAPVSLRHEPYRSKKYTGQRDAVASRMHMELNDAHAQQR